MEIILVSLVVLPLIFPIVYAYLKKIDNQFLYISAAYGATFIIGCLLLVAASPLLVLDTWFIPQLEVSGYLSNLKLLVTWGYWVTDKAYIFSLLIHIPVSIGLYRKYEIFNKTHNKNKH